MDFLRLFPRSLGSLLTVAWIAAAPGCGSEAPTGTGQQAIYGGTIDDKGSDSIVALRIGAGSSFALCTGTVVAPNLVMTAWHCVASTVSASVACDANGQSMSGAQLGVDVLSAEVQVFVGVRPNLYGSPRATGDKIFHASGNVLCNDDIAFVSVDQPLGVTPSPLRLSSGTHPGETLHVIGYGENNGGFGTAVRVVSPDITVRAIGTSISASKTPLGSGEFELGMSACQGDSGGPALDANGAVVGIVSRGGNCTDDFGHVYMQPRGVQAVMNTAFAYVGAQPLSEGGAVADSGAQGDDASAPSGGDLRAGAHACSGRIAPRGGLTAWPLILLATLRRRKSHHVKS